ncbi:DUF3055 domain-containing protein [Numidum massiliense]|uniref:DUF3055 domain-containing protein n=1 Tax=Numidum massiliense TaxID=1522315 RepID=UPI0006D54D58|nr:DUF3055 domain-containing protein [Numidum massiliense]
MAAYERLYDESEQAHVRYVGFLTEKNRYDLGIVYTSMFFGKTLVVDMQTGRSALLCEEEVDQLSQLQKLFNLDDLQEAEQLASFLKVALPKQTPENQY